MGKGTIGINPFHTDRSIMSPVAVAGLLSTIIAFTDAKACAYHSSLFGVELILIFQSFSINHIGCFTLS